MLRVFREEAGRCIALPAACVAGIASIADALDVFAANIGTISSQQATIASTRSGRERRMDGKHIAQV